MLVLPSVPVTPTTLSWRDGWSKNAAAAGDNAARESATTIAFAASNDKAKAAALSFAATCGKNAVALKDRAGLVVFRTLLQLANCAGDAVRDEVASPDAVDVAMMNGVNYPFGPIAWARGEGLGHVVHALDAVAEECGEAMYRPGEWLRSAARRGLL